MRVLLIEDDPMIGRAVVAGLQDAGYTVDWVRDGAEAELALGHRVYDLTLLDLGLPRRDGVELLKGLRRDGSSLPVVIITARDALADRVAGLDLGADDYLVKPFDLDELLARARAVMRRKSGRSTPDMACGALTADPVGRGGAGRGAPPARRWRAPRPLPPAGGGWGRPGPRGPRPGRPGNPPPPPHGIDGE